MAHPAALAATALVTDLAVPLQNNRARRREDEEQRVKPSPLSLENSVIARFNEDDARNVFLLLKDEFYQQPGLILELINKSGLAWQFLPLVGLLVTPRTKYLHFKFFGSAEAVMAGMEEDPDWSMYHLFDSIAENCSESLHILEIEHYTCELPVEDEDQTRPPVKQLLPVGNMLLQLHALTSVRLLYHSCSMEQADSMVSCLATSNPNIRSLTLRDLSAQSLATIADCWPELEILECAGKVLTAADRARHRRCVGQVVLTSADLAAALYKLRCLRTLNIVESIKSQAMLEVSRAPDPGTWPLEGNFVTPNPPFSGRDMSGTFSCFPCLEDMTMVEDEIPQVVEGLEGRQTKITTLQVECTSGNPLALRPLLDTPMGRNLTNITILKNEDPFTIQRVDLALIGHCCKMLEDLTIYASILMASDEYQVDGTYFRKLKHSLLCHYGVGPEGHIDIGNQLPDPIVGCVLAGPGLVEFDSEGVPISDAVASSLAEESGEGGALSSLREITISHGDVSVRAVAIISSHAPRLRTVKLSYREAPRQHFEEKRDVIIEFFRQSELPVELVMVSQES